MDISITREEALVVGCLLGYLNDGKCSVSTMQLTNHLLDTFEITDDEISDAYDYLHFVPREIKTELDINNKLTVSLLDMEIIYKKG